MKLRTWTKLGLAAVLLAASALPARAGMVTVTALDGVNLSYTATETPSGPGTATLDVSFNSLNFVSKINGSPIAAIGATFPDMLLTLTVPSSGGAFLVPGPGPNSYGVTDFTHVVFDYLTPGGSQSGNNLTLTGSVVLHSGSPTTLTVGTTTYDFSPFLTAGAFNFSLNASVGSIAAVLAAGSGTFSGSASFSQNATVTPEPSSILLMGIGGIVTVAARRRRKA